MFLKHLRIRLTQTEKLKIMFTSITISSIALLILSKVFPNDDVVGNMVGFFIWGNLLLWVYIYFIHNLRYDMKKLKVDVEDIKEKVRD